MGEDDVNRETSAERRIAPRVDARLPLQLTEPDTRLVVTTESIDLSRSGIACRTGEYLAPLSKVAVTVILPPFGSLSKASRSLRAEGVVVRCEPAAKANGEEMAEREYDLACCFTALEPDARNLLDAFVAWRLLRSVRSDDERVPSGRSPISSPSRGHGGHARHGARPRTGGRTGGPRHGGGYRDDRRTSSREGGRSSYGQGGHAAPRGGSHPRGERGRPPRGAHPGRGHAPGQGQGHGDARHTGTGRPRRDRPPRGRPQGEGRAPEGRGEQRAGGTRGERPERGRGRGPRRGGRGGWRGERRGQEPRSAREERDASTAPRPEHGAPERSEERPRDEKRGTWGRRPARRPSPKPRGTDPDRH